MKPASTTNFVMHRDRTIASTMGLSIAFKKGEPTPVPMYMVQEVIAAGGVPEDELSDEDIKGSNSTEPSDPNARQEAVFAVFEDMMLRNIREEFTAGGIPHKAIVDAKLGWALSAKERDTLFAKFKIGHAD